MRKVNIDLSIVIPCYNEIEHINQSMKELIEFMDATKLNYELIFIDDGSIDGTAKEIDKLSEKYTCARLYKHPANIGRGSAVYDGIMRAKGNIVGFIDIDLDVSPVYILPCYFCIKGGYDVVTANRIYRINISNMHRWILSKGYNYLTRKLLDVPFTDTEAGFKFFNREKIIPILKEIKNVRWFWDTEVIVRSYLKNYKIKELPALYFRNEHKTSTVLVFRDSKDYFVNLIKFRKEVKRLKSATNEK